MGDWECTVEGVGMNFWQNRRVLVTGHTGFKGGWLAVLLHMAGARVTGVGLAPETDMSLFAAAGIGALVDSRIIDIRDFVSLEKVLAEARPEVVFHLAAQPLVRASYSDPLGTYGTNVMGTANLLEAVRRVDSIRGVVVVTTDKCYENREWVWAYRETDRLGGFDPYSSSKECAELLVAAFRNSFFSPDHYDRHGVALATARAGNVIGGGDWSSDRLIPDILRAFEQGRMLQIRSPHAIRPWQHVLEPLRGYLLLGQSLVERGIEDGEAWNFAPEASDAKTVEWIVCRLAKTLGVSWKLDAGDHPHEAATLKLDWSKAEQRLGWSPTLSLDKALHYTADWHCRFRAGEDARKVTIEQAREFQRQAEGWALDSCGALSENLAMNRENG